MICNIYRRKITRYFFWKRNQLVTVVGSVLLSQEFNYEFLRNAFFRKDKPEYIMEPYRPYFCTVFNTLNSILFDPNFLSSLY